MERSISFDPLRRSHAHYMCHDSSVNKSTESKVFLFLFLTYTLIRKLQISFRVVFSGFTLQFVVALLVLKWKNGLRCFEWLSEKTVAFLHFTYYGTNFVFGFLSSPPNICSMQPVFFFTVIFLLCYST